MKKIGIFSGSNQQGSKRKGIEIDCCINGKIKIKRVGFVASKVDLAIFCLVITV